jgi:hypothetical protein
VFQTWPHVSGLNENGRTPFYDVFLIHMLYSIFII